MLQTSRLSMAENGNDANDVFETKCMGDMTLLRAKTAKLKLVTRRDSYVKWRQTYIEMDKLTDIKTWHVTACDQERITTERLNNISKSIDWVLLELKKMKGDDQVLAKRLMTLCRGIYQFKLERRCLQHEELINDMRTDMGILQEIHDISDLPLDTVTANPLKHIGITRMNIGARRFSTC